MLAFNGKIRDILKPWAQWRRLSQAAWKICCLVARLTSTTILTSCIKWRHPAILYIGNTYSCSFLLIRGSGLHFSCRSCTYFCLDNDTPYYLPFVTNHSLLPCRRGTAKRLWKVCSMPQVSGKPRPKMCETARNSGSFMEAVPIAKPWNPQANLSSTGWMIWVRKPFWNWIWQTKAGWTILMPCDITPIKVG